jgi:hypothetical protein
MRRKKRYVLLKNPDAALREGGKILFQNEEGYVLRVSPKAAEKLRVLCIRISGSIKKFKTSQKP